MHLFSLKGEENSPNTLAGAGLKLCVPLGRELGEAKAQKMSHLGEREKKKERNENFQVDVAKLALGASSLIAAPSLRLAPPPRAGLLQLQLSPKLLQPARGQTRANH